MISFIISVYDRISALNACLASLSVQSVERDVHVCCNCTTRETEQECDMMAELYGGMSHNTGWHADNCYDSANWVAPKAIGEWICFPSDDSLYVSRFSEIMLGTAERTGSDLVYCDCVYAVGSESNNAWKQYEVLDVQPRMGRIDKTCFILRRELFQGFPPHPRNWRDGALIEKLIVQGVKYAKAPGVLCIHQ